MIGGAKKLGLLVGALFLAACSKPEMYYYGDYSSTLYAFKKEPSAETRQAHVDSLRDIIEESKDYELRVPPGIYAELGYWLAQNGKSDEAVRFFRLEKNLYPESARLMDRLIDQAEG